MSTPHSPANKPIAQQRVVRGDAVLRLPGSVGGPDPPRFSWPGAVDSLDESPPWVMEGATTWSEVVVGWLVSQTGVVFDIKVNGTTIETITTSGSSPQTAPISVEVVRDDAITLELTDFDDGTGEDLSVCLRYEIPGL